MVDPAHVDPLHLVAVGAERGERADVPHQQDAGPRIFLPLGQPLQGLLGRGEHDVDVRRHAHAVEVLFPRTGAHRVVHQHDELRAQRLPPTHDYLSMDQPVVDPKQRDAHAAGVRIALVPASAARRAASAGDRSRWNTKSSSMARLTPVITATSDLPFASRTALVKHEPPGRSTNRTAGLSPIARARRAARAPESHPSLLTATSASLTPVSAATAGNSACATAACETITPRVGSLIVFLEILQHFPALGHAVEQPL